MKYYYISYWLSERNMFCSQLIDYFPLEWYKTNWKDSTLISWQEISKDDYVKYLGEI